MDPIADKLLIVAALVALVSSDRLAAWVAMVIIAREFAVTVLRVAVGTQQGVVIPASAFGQDQDAFQVAMVMLLIAVHGGPGVVDGAGLRDRRRDGAVRRRLLLRAAPRSRRPRPTSSRPANDRGGRSRLAALGEPSSQACAAGVADAGMPVSSSRRISPSVPNRSATHVVLVDRLEVHLAGRRRTRGRRARGSARRRPDHLAHAVLDEPRPAVGLLDHVRPRRSASSARRSPRTSTARRSRAASPRRSRRRTARCSRCAASRARAGCGSRPGRPRGSARSRRRSKPRARAALARRGGDQLLGARAGCHALGGDADQPARSELGRERRAVQRVDLLGLDRPRPARACARGSAPRR